MPPSCFAAVGKALYFRLIVPEPPSFFARERAYRGPHLKERGEKDTLSDNLVNLTHCTDPFVHLGPSSIQDFG